VCFAGDIYIYDCIEFNDRFRYCDTASEIAFLAMDIDRYGRADLSDSFVKAYIRASGDGELDALLNFYKCYRAYVRGKVACFKYDDPYLKNKDSILQEAQLYFDLAYRYAFPRPALIIVTGLIGTGKTTVAEAIGRGLGCTVLSSDVIRKELAGIPPPERHYDSFAAGLYSPQSTKKTYSEIFRRAGELLDKGHPVVLDASFRKRSDRLAARDLAAEYGAVFLAVECVAPDETIRQRLEKRSRAGSVSDGRWEIFADIKKDFDPVDELPPDEHLALDTVSPSGNIIASILQRMSVL
jgi:predicted kinase